MDSAIETVDIHSHVGVVDTSMGTYGTSPRVPSSSPKSVAFWLVFFSLCISSFLSALDLVRCIASPNHILNAHHPQTTISTALPTIVSDLENVSGLSGAPASSSAGAYIWVGSAFSLAGTAILPWTGGLAQIWGRKGVLLLSLFLFLAGSAICGSARSLDILIAGRGMLFVFRNSSSRSPTSLLAIQGLGDGGIISLSEIIVSDLVPLTERGTFEGILGVVWALASAIGPPLGGVFSHHKRWRWLFCAYSLSHLEPKH